MDRKSEQPFDSIESAYDFSRILSDAVNDAKRDIEGLIQAQMQRATSPESSRQLDALRIVYYSLEKLGFHTNCNRRLLNDLRSLRRLLFEERAASKAPTASKPASTPVKAAAPGPAQLPSPGARPNGKNGGVAVA
jgi:hypothetical protein